MNRFESHADLQELSLERLRAVVEPLRDHKAPPFQNWARSVKCHPRAVYKPETEEQIRHLVELARREGTELRAYGAGHSPSDLVCTDGYLLSLDNMQKLLNVDRQRKRMSFQAGILLREVHPVARKEGLAISSLGSISEQSLGGVLSTAAHGVGLKYPTLSGMTTSITLIKADTSIVTCSAEENADLFHATLCGLGCTGIITQVTLQLEPDFRLKEEIFAMDPNDFIESLETDRDGGEHGLLGSAEHVRCWFFPHNGYVKVSRLNRTTEPKPTSNPPSFVERWFNQFIVANYVNQLGMFIGRYIPSVLKVHEQVMWHLTHNPHRLPQNQPTESKFRWKRLGAPVYSVAPSNEIFNYDCGPRQYTFEGCVPITRLEECLRALDRWFKAEAKSPNGLQYHFPMEIRPVDQDDVWLSPAYKCRVVYIGIQIYKPFGFIVPHDELFQRFENILGEHGGRPHWAKAHNHSPEKLDAIYPKFQDFLKVRDEVDPTKLFVNHYLRRHLLGLEVGLQAAYAARGSGEWHGAFNRAKQDVARLTNAQKASLATCIGWEKGPGVANIASIKQIDFPGLTLQDGPNGIRFTDHASAFPAQINAAATWDKELCRRRGEALGAEARGKGIHVLLAPTMNMGRVPCGGRNFESSGADPYLTGEVAYEIIKGIQSKGVQAVAKHFICNEQEHFRQQSSSNVDDKTLHTIYLHPFLRSVQAGVASVMSSYNQLNGTWTSEHHELLNKILKKDLDFQGYVQSDWWAQRSGIPSAVGGLDMTCPGEDVYDGKDTFYGPHLVKAVENGDLPQWRLDDMAIRILSSYYLLKQDEAFPSTNFNSWDLSDEATNQHVDVTADHGNLIRELGAASIVLLKNDGILPLTGPKQPRQLAVVGNCAGDSPLGPNQSGSGGPNIRIGETVPATPGVTAMGWGSATANFPYLVSPLTAIQAHAKEHKIPLEWHLDNENLDRLNLIARPAEVAIVFISASSGEGYITVEDNFGDRNNMEAWGNGAALVKAVCEVNKNVIVVIHSVGPILLEEFIDHPNVKACLHAGCLGQEAGNAVADVLFGKSNPSGRLPFTIAKKEEDYGTRLTYEKAGNEDIVQIDYKEGLFIDYRSLQKNGIKPRYCFGHGLSYSTFSYKNLTVVSHGKIDDISAEERKGNGSLTREALHKPCVTVSVDIANESGPAGKEIVQLYLEFPKNAAEAPLVLRGFEAITLRPKEKRTVTFSLSRYSLSSWSEESNFWKLAKGSFVVKVGASLEDIRLSETMQV